IHFHYILDREEGEGELAALFCADHRLRLRIIDVHQVDMTDAPQKTLIIGGSGVDEDNAFHLRRVWIAGSGVRAGAGKSGVAFAIIALDDQRAAFIDEIEIADRSSAFTQPEAEAGARPLALLRVEGHDTQEIAFRLAIFT